MTDDFSGSDDNRNGGALKYARSITFDGDFALELGSCIENVSAVFETYGQLNADASNAVLICHALTGDSHVAKHNDVDDPGWWDIAIGPGKAIDTDKYFVICPNVLGSCRGSTGPNSINPKTGKPFGKDFPEITIGDMVELHKKVVDHLGIDQLLAIVGGSMGGHQALQWALRYPQRTKGVALLATSPRLSSQSLAFDVIGRNSIRHDPNFNDGDFYESGKGPDTGLALARMLGHITYLSPEAMTAKFEATRNQPRDIDTIFEKEFSVGSYLAYQGHKFTERFDANSYITLTLAMDKFDLGESIDELQEKFAGSQSRWLVVSFTSDWLFPPEQSQQMVSALIKADKPVSYCNIESNCGHDAFLLPANAEDYGGLMEGFLGSLDGKLPNGENRPADHSPTSIFHHTRRVDYDTIAELIQPGDSVLDLGCCHGGLLEQLRNQGNTRLSGVEISTASVLECVRYGFDVVHEDLNSGLNWFGDDQFDVVVLSRTIQAVMDVEKVMDEMLRVGRRCIVSVPNFSYYKLMDMLTSQGIAPEAGLLHYKWYNTPNIRVVTLRDFENFCEAKGIKIHEKISLETEKGLRLGDNDDTYSQADIAIYVVSK